MPVTLLRFVNADLIAAERWPDDPVGHSYAAARAADQQRAELIDARVSFGTETVFSRPSKFHLLTRAHDSGYLITLHVLAVPVSLAVARVPNRVAHGGHHVPGGKVRGRYGRLGRTVPRRSMVPVSSAAIRRLRAVCPLARLPRR